MTGSVISGINKPPMILEVTGMPDLCCIKGCDRPVEALGLCVNHWRMNKKHGSPVAVRPLSAINRGLSATERFWKSVRKTAGCWEWTASRDRDGYGMFAAEIFGVRTTKAHRFSLMLHTGIVLDEYQLVMHSCDNPPCVNPDHLSPGTHLENTADMIAKGRHMRGRRGASAKISKLTEDQVREILRDPRPYAEIAAAFSIHKQHVVEIKSRTSRRFVEFDDAEIVRNKRGAAGEARSKMLTDGDIRDIRASSETGVALAGKYGVSQQTITDIRKYRSWKHVA